MVGAIPFISEAMPQDCVAAQDIKELSGHSRHKPLDAVGVEFDPLAMGSRHADRSREPRHERGEPEQLRLLPTHHVFRACLPLAKAGEDTRRGQR